MTFSIMDKGRQYEAPIQITKLIHYFPVPMPLEIPDHFLMNAVRIVFL